MDNREFQIGSTYISGFNDREYTFTGVKKGFAWVVGADGIERPVTIGTFKDKYTLKPATPNKKNVAV